MGEKPLSPALMVARGGMIRVRTFRRLGATATDYNFSDGLSDDTRLPAYLQNLTPTQLQTALDGGTPSMQDMLGPQLNLTDCTTNYDPSICGPPLSNPLSSLLPASVQTWLGNNQTLPVISALNAVPGWAWIGGGALIVFALVKGRR